MFLEADAEVVHIDRTPPEPQRLAWCDWLERHGIDPNDVALPGDISEHLVAWLRQRLDETAMWALEASRHGDEPLIETGEHWRWECTEHDEVIDPDPLTSELLGCPQTGCGWQHDLHVHQYVIHPPPPSAALTTGNWSQLAARIADQTIPLCRWCAELTEALLGEHERRWG